MFAGERETQDCLQLPNIMLNRVSIWVDLLKKESTFRARETFLTWYHPSSILHKKPLSWYYSHRKLVLGDNCSLQHGNWHVIAMLSSYSDKTPVTRWKNDKGRKSLSVCVFYVEIRMHSNRWKPYNRRGIVYGTSEKVGAGSKNVTVLIKQESQCSS